MLIFHDGKTVQLNHILIDNSNIRLRGYNIHFQDKSAREELQRSSKITDFCRPTTIYSVEVTVVHNILLIRFGAGIFVRPGCS